MSTIIRSTLSQVRVLLDSQEYRQALSELKNIVASSELDLAKMRVLRVSAMVGLGVFELSEIDQALDELRLAGDIEWFPLAKYLRARVLIHLGRFIDASEEANESYVYYRRQGNETGMGDSANLLSYIAFQQSDYVTAIPCAERAINHYSTAHCERQAESVRLNLVMIQLRAGQLTSAKQGIDSLPDGSVDELTSDRKYNYYHRAAILHLLLFQFDEAKRLLSEAELLPIGLRRERCHQLEISGHVYSLSGDFARAEQFLVAGEKLAFEIAPDSTFVSQIKRLFGDLYVLTCRFDLAEKFADDGLAVAQRVNERLEIAACYRVLAQVETHRGNRDKAREWYKKAIDLFNLISARYELAVTRYLASCSGLHEQNERVAMLYLAKEYFESEQVTPYIEKVGAELAKLSGSRLVLHKPSGENGRSKVIAASEPMRKILEKVSYIAPSDMNVLLTGETGTGKDLLAEHIHTQSGRTGRFVSVNVAALPTEMMESELFGHSKGAFTGARIDKPGLMQEADEGTLFLNEIGEASPELQAKLLQVLETRRLRRLGETVERQVNFRLIAATNVDLAERIRDGRFRSDLYHRLNQATITLPPLSERPEDIAALVPHFLALEGCSLETANGELDQLVRVLVAHSWPGNVRELASVVRRLWVMTGGDISRMVEVVEQDNQELDDPDDLSSVLAECGGNQRKAARMLRISESTLRYRLKKNGE